MKKNFNVKINNQSYIVEVEEVSVASSSIRELPAQLSSKIGHIFSKKEATGISSVNAPLPGLIVEILVKEGQSVKSGDKLLVLEAMKMENTILAPVTGTIDKITVKVGDSVNGKQLMITIKR
ncbi:MAG: acetyl-CoA carboxylase biotin carboxyl carrier protein subunit [Lentisphaerota bacterium]